MGALIQIIDVIIMDIDYWFAKYDSESFEKDFTKVSYNDILQ